MKTLLMVVVLCLCGAVQASEDFTTISLGSYHFDRRQFNGDRWNENNFGIGFERQYEKVTLGVGGYLNSYNKNTAYAVAKYEPIQFGYMRAGVFLGVASGYEHAVVGGLSASITVNRFGVSMFMVPKVSKFTTTMIGTQLRIGI